jgi:hypothetical protein
VTTSSAVSFSLISSFVDSSSFTFIAGNLTLGFFTAEPSNENWKSDYFNDQQSRQLRFGTAVEGSRSKIMIKKFLSAL